MSEKQLRSNPDNRWDFLAGVLPHKINPTDIDLVYERRGYFLFLEGKRMGAQMTTGQRRFYDALHNPPRFIVVQFFGEPPDDVKAFSRWREPLKVCDTEGFREEIRKWFQWVEGLQSVSGERG